MPSAQPISSRSASSARVPGTSTAASRPARRTLRQTVEIGRGDRATLARSRTPAEVTFENLGDNVLIVSYPVAVPVARESGQAVEAFEGPEEDVFLCRRQIKENAVDVEDDGGISH